jgi:ABC-type uncharacterized transport system substrate-binding protein
MRRSGFVAALTATVALPVASSASAAGLTKIAVLVNQAEADPTKVLRDGLRPLSYEFRAFEGDYSALPRLAAELVAWGPDIFAIVGAVECRAVMKLTSAIPIVFAIVPDAVAAGLVSNDQSPTGNATGFTCFDPQQPRQQQQ